MQAAVHQCSLPQQKAAAAAVSPDHLREFSWPYGATHSSQTRWPHPGCRIPPYPARLRRAAVLSLMQQRAIVLAAEEGRPDRACGMPSSGTQYGSRKHVDQAKKAHQNAFSVSYGRVLSFLTGDEWREAVCSVSGLELTP